MFSSTTTTKIFSFPAQAPSELFPFLRATFSSYDKLLTRSTKLLDEAYLSWYARCLQLTAELRYGWRLEVLVK
jgi:hypothetical protein